MDYQALEKIALSVRALSMDAIQKANSGHPGLPLGAAELGALLYGEILHHDPTDPTWVDRDRFILSAGHGSMFLYALLYLAGYAVSLEDIKTFRQVGSKCAGHPEYGSLPGVEMTTGPLGQGLATAVGLAIAETRLAACFNDSRKIVDHYTYVLAGDGCLQEGVSHEACSLAGHLKLGKLIVFYDSNDITIDGPTDLAFTEDVARRYEAYGWQVLKGSMYDFQAIADLIASAKAESAKPSIIILRSVIGKSAPTKQGTADAHGAPLGAEEVAAAKKALGLTEDFFVAPEALDYFAAKRESWKKAREAWQSLFDDWSKANPEKRLEWDTYQSGHLPAAVELPSFKLGDKLATRSASNKALNAIAEVVPNLVGGSADLKGPNAVGLTKATSYSANDRTGRYIHFGVREFAMAAICNGLQLHGGLRAFCSTFMVFSDYLRPALRLSALMKQPVIYVFTHDSIYVGEDGPTHQPVEHLAAIRAIPGLRLLRPADAEESAQAWLMAMEHREGPVVLAFTRQAVPVFPKADPDWPNTMRTGAYIVKKPDCKPEVVLIATGSEVALALEAAAKSKKKVQVISMVSKELFESQPESIRRVIIPDGLRIVVCEAAVSCGWERWAKPEDIFSINRFGESGPGKAVADYLGFNCEQLVALIDSR